MSSTVKERAIEFVKFKCISMKTFETMCGLSTGYVTSMRKGFGPDKLNNVLTAFPELNRDWLLYGEGPMVKDKFVGKSSDGPKNSLPIFEDAKFGCSPSGFEGALEKNKADGYMVVPGLVYDGQTFIVRARGESMINKDNPERSIPNGAYVAIRKSNLSTLQWGEAYALSTDDGCIIKRLYPSDHDDCVKCVSFNEKEYPSFELHSSEIHDIGIVKAVLTVSIWK